jgi:hypothetical protein
VGGGGGGDSDDMERGNIKADIHVFLTQAHIWSSKKVAFLCQNINHAADEKLLVRGVTFYVFFILRFINFSDIFQDNKYKEILFTIDLHS